MIGAHIKINSVVNVVRKLIGVMQSGELYIAGDKKVILYAEKGLVVGVLQTSNPATLKNGNTQVRKALYAVRENNLKM